ncbi:MAG: hypothetical protein ACXVB0_12925 [Mucilaginibacter sp.]
MKKVFKKILYTLVFLVLAIVILGLVLAWWPVQSKINNKGITPAEAVLLRQHYAGPHNLFTTTDGLTLFLRRWNPPRIDSVKKDIAILIFHGFTAYSGPYNMAGEPISSSSITSTQKRPNCSLVVPYTEINRRMPIQLARVSLRVIIFVRTA